MYDRKMCSAFARADSCGIFKPAKGPCCRNVGSGLGGSSPSADGVGESEVLARSSLRPGVCVPWPLPLPAWSGTAFSILLGAGLRSLMLGKSRSKILMIGAKCDPASTAMVLPRCHPSSTDRTRNPVTFSSHGPPEFPRHITCNAGFWPCRPVLTLAVDS